MDKLKADLLKQEQEKAAGKKLSLSLPFVTVFLTGTSFAIYT